MKIEAITNKVMKIEAITKKVMKIAHIASRHWINGKYTSWLINFRSSFAKISLAIFDRF